MKQAAYLFSALLAAAGLSMGCVHAATAEGLHAALAVKPNGYWNDVFDDLTRQIQDTFAQHKIELAYTTLRRRSVYLKLTDESRAPDAKALLLDLTARDQKNDAGGTQIYEVVGVGKVGFTISPTAQSIENTNKMLLDQTMEILRRRMQGLTRSPVAVRSISNDRFVIDVPGFVDLGRFRGFFTPEKLTVHLVDDAVSDADIREHRVPSDDVVMKQRSPSTSDPPLLAVKKIALLFGDHIMDALNTINESTGRPEVSLRLDHEGASLFAKITRENVGRQLAIVMGDEVIEAPHIEDPILNGEVEIEGEFTQELAAALAVLLRGDAMPAPVQIVKAEVTKFR